MFCHCAKHAFSPVFYFSERQYKIMSKKEDTRKTSHGYSKEPEEMIKQNSSYERSGVCAPDNNPFWEKGGNPLSSKGN